MISDTTALPQIEITTSACGLLVMTPMLPGINSPAVWAPTSNPRTIKRSASSAGLGDLCVPNPSVSHLLLHLPEQAACHPPHDEYAKHEHSPQQPGFEIGFLLRWQQLLFATKHDFLAEYYQGACLGTKILREFVVRQAKGLWFNLSAADGKRKRFFALRQENQSLWL